VKKIDISLIPSQKSFAPPPKEVICIILQDVFMGSLAADGDRSVSRVRFQHVFTPAWDMALTSKNIKAGKYILRLHP